MIFGGHRTSSTSVFRHLCDLPSMKTRALTLVMKYCFRLRHLPPDCLISLLDPLVPHHRLAALRRNKLFASAPLTPPPNLKLIVAAYRQEQLQYLRTKQKLLHACRPTIGIDPILTLPTTRRERSRLLRWRMGWLPGRPGDCPCNTDHTSRRHMAVCELIPSHLRDELPLPPPDGNPIDFAISTLPKSAAVPTPNWSALLTILLHIDRITHPDTRWKVDRPNE